MLATANSAIAAVQLVKEAGARNIKMLCLLAAPEGINAFQEAHPDVPIITAAIDDHLNEHGYIVPGLGDAGDRIYGTSSNQEKAENIINIKKLNLGRIDLGRMVKTSRWGRSRPIG